MADENVLVRGILLTEDVIPGKHYVAIPGAGNNYVDKDAVIRGVGDSQPVGDSA